MDEDHLYVTCPCQHCSGKIEFDASDFQQNKTDLVICPHCQMETMLFVPSVAPPILVPPAIPQPIWFGNEESFIKIRTISGIEIEIEELRLYDQREINEIKIGKAQVEELLGGAQSPFGFIGDAFWVVGNMMIQNYIVQKQSDKMAKNGFNLIKQITYKEQQLRKTKNFFPVGRIENIDCPTPCLWRAAQIDSGFIHNGDDFIVFKDSEGAIHSIRWNTIETFNFQLTR